MRARAWRISKAHDRVRAVRAAIYAGLCLAPLFAASPAWAWTLYGAIAYSPVTGGVGYSYNFRSRSGAENDALSHCSTHGAGCIVVIWFQNGCGALAVSGSGHGYGSGWSWNVGNAENIALNSCRASDCYVARWVCTAR
jgi:Domain of unknown function (DUF4189)